MMVVFVFWIMWCFALGHITYIADGRKTLGKYFWMAIAFHIPLSILIHPLQYLY